jgi:hypothetical protein
MKKNLNLFPLILLGLYLIFVNSNEGISFTIKMIILGVIILISSSILYKKMINKEKSKSSIIIFAAFVLLTITTFIYSYNLV